MFKQITRTVFLVSIISLLNDFSSEMLYPVIPLYLKEIGYGSILIGFLEGVAEFIAGFSKIYMGSLSDRFQKRLPFIQIGYSLSVISRPLLGLLPLAPIIFISRSLDRIGKGIRSGARDALLADECHEGNRAEVFGFHRSMDTAGAVLGPLSAMVFLYFYPTHYKTIFLISIIPGILAILSTFWIKEKKGQPLTLKPAFSLRQNINYFQQASPQFRQIILPLFFFSLLNSSDMFLLLQASQLSIAPDKIIFLYLLFNVVYMLFAFPMGKLADARGKVLVFLVGIFFFALTYFGFALTSNLPTIFCLFVGYGLFYACTQGAIKSILLQFTNAGEKSSAIGFYEGGNSIGLLIANSMAGLIWYQWGAQTLFLYTAVGSCLFMVWFWITVVRVRKIN